MTNPPYSNNFDTIDLDETPKLDIDFGNGLDKKDANSGSGSGFGGFGAWGTKWNTSKHDSNPEDAETTDITDITKDKIPEETSLWSFGGNAKNKKKMATADFDYGDFSNFKETQEDPEALDTKVGAGDEWPGALGAGKKDKKSKKKNVFNFEETPDPEPQLPATGTSIAKSETAKEDSWAGDGWAATTAKNTKKKGKKGETEPKPSGQDAIPQPPPAAIIASPVEDEWGSFSSKKKKKGKKTGIEEVENAEEPSGIDVVPEPAAGSAWGANGMTDDRGAFNAKKEKKKAPKNGAEEDEEPTTMDFPEPKPVANSIWGANGGIGEWGTFGTKKEKKPGKKNTIEEVEESSKKDVVDKQPVADLGWGADGGIGNWGGFTKKKGKKDAVEEFEDPSIKTLAEPELEPAAETEWGVNDKYQKKKTKKGAIEEIAKFDEKSSTLVQESEPAAEIGWGSAAKKGPKKNKKEVFEELDKGKGQADIDTESKPEIDISWGMAQSKNDKKKPKKGVTDDSKQKEEPVSPVVAKFEVDSKGFEPKDLENKKQKKKGKKGVADEPENVGDPVVADFADPYSNFGWDFDNKKDKTTSKNGFEDVEDPGFPAMTEPLTNISWGLGAKNDTKKSKNKFSDGSERIEETVESIHEPEPEPIADLEWGSLTSKIGKKKGKKTAPEDTRSSLGTKLVDIPEVPVVETKIDLWGTSAKKDKKNKKSILAEVIEDPIVVSEAAAATEATTNIMNDDWMELGGLDTKKDKKGKKGAAADAKKEEDLSPPPPPAAPEIPNPSSSDLWGPQKKDKDKKAKKGKAAEPEPEPFVIPEPVVNNNLDTVEPGWGTWGLSAKDKKKKEKEKEKEEQEKKEQEEKESAEKQSEREKMKSGKKSKLAGASGVSKAKDLVAEFTSEPIPTIEEDKWGSWGGAKKIGKKGNKNHHDAPPPAPTPPAQGLTPEPTPSPVPDLDFMAEDDWADPVPVKSKAKKDAKKPAKDEDWKSDKKAAQEKAGEHTVESPKNKLKSTQKEETPAKVAKNFWSNMGSTAPVSTKSKTAKDKEKVDEEEANDLIDFGLEADLIDEVIDEPAAKWAKSKADSKVSKVSKGSAKESDKSSKLSEKKKKTNANPNSNVRDVEETEEVDFVPEMISPIVEEPKAKEDAWGFWGTAKKTSGNSGKKEKEKTDEPKREITKQSWANQMPSLKDFSNQPEPPVMDDQPEPQITTKNSTSKTAMSSVKPTKSSVAQKVKALEKEKLEKEKEKERERQRAREKQKALEPIESPAFEEFDPLAKLDSLPKKISAFGKPKVITAGKSSPPKKKDLSPPTAQDKQSIKDLLPGSFPAEGAEDDDDDDDEDIIDVIVPPPVEKKTNKKQPKGKKEPKMDLMDFSIPMTPAPEVPEVPEALPTPPPEPVLAKPVKKDRARVVRDEGASSWGFWSASPKKPVKKDVKSKDDTDIPAPVVKERTAPTGLARSKSTKTAKEKEVEKSSAKSSGSDKDKKQETRPSKTRGSSFGALFGPPPARAKTVRRPSAVTSKTTSRRQSFDANATGISSPLAKEVPEMSSKAAKLMGTSPTKVAKKASTQGKRKAAGIHLSQSGRGSEKCVNLRDVVVPDPYPIDDDDLVMVNGLEDPIINAAIPKASDVRRDESGKTKAKKEVNFISSSKKGFGQLRSPQRVVLQESGKANTSRDFEQTKPAPELMDDIVMVEAGPSSEGAELPSFQEALDLAEPARAPPPLQRSSTSARKPDNKLMGLFGGFRKTRRASESFERPRTKSFADDDGKLRRKRPVASGSDGAKRIRRDDRQVRRSERPEPAADGFMTDAPIDGELAGAEDVEDRRKEERRTTKVSKPRTKDSREPRLRDEGDQKIKRQEYDQVQDDTRRASYRDSKDRRARREDEEVAIRKEERRAKRAAREERPAKQGSLSREPDFIPTPERRSKRREKESQDKEILPESSSYPRKSDRRQSHDIPLSPSAPERRPRRDERRSSHRTPDERSSRHRKSGAAPVNDYFDLRNGTSNDIPENPPLEPHDPYIPSGAKDQTSSWVQSQISEPALPPPLEQSVLDPPPILGGAGAGGAAGDESTVDEDTRRTLRRKSRRQSKYAETGIDKDRIRDRDRDRDRDLGDADRRHAARTGRRDGAVRSSEGSDERDRDRGRERVHYRRKSEVGGVPLASSGRGLGGPGAGMGAKRGSWFQKIKGLADGR